MGGVALGLSSRSDQKSTVGANLADPAAGRGARRFLSVTSTRCE